MYALDMLYLATSGLKQMLYIYIYLISFMEEISIIIMASDPKYIFHCYHKNVCNYILGPNWVCNNNINYDLHDPH